MTTTSTWLETVGKNKASPALSQDSTADVVIVGGGITGITTAYLLSKEGKKVVLIEKNKIRGEATSLTTAFLTHIIDSDLTDLVSMIGEEKAKQVWQSHIDATDYVEKIVQEEKIDCEFTRVPSYMISASEKDYEDLKEEVNTAKDLGFTHLTPHTDTKIPVKNYGYVKVKNQAKFHPLKYLQVVQKKAEENGALFFEDTEAEEIEQLEDDSVKVKTKAGVISAPYLVIATYDPFNHPIELFAHKGPYISYVLEIDFPKGVLEEALYEDTNNPYNYFRLDVQEDKEYDRLILGGADHRKEVPIDPEKNFQALKDYFEEVFPNVELKIAKKWSGPILEPSDGLAYIGRVSHKKSRQLVGMEFSGNGMTYSMIAAQMFRDIILGKKNKYEELYHPTRVPSFKQVWQKGKDYVGEFFGGAAKNIFKKPETE